MTSVAEVDRLDQVRPALDATGAVLVRGLPVRTPDQLARVRERLGFAVADGLERYAPTTDLGRGVYSAPEWGADREMCPHHEQAHRTVAPRLLLMAGAAQADDGGSMMLADTRAVLDRVPEPLVRRFRADGWILERNFRPYLGLPWTVAFGRSDPAELTRYAAAEDMELDRADDGSVHTRQRRPAVVVHPVTGEPCWWNDVAYFSQWSVDETERKVLLSAFGAGGIPFNTSFGDGTALSAEDWQGIVDAYESVTVRLALADGDLLVLDNVLMAHGRTPYSGSRTVLVAAAEPVRVVGAVGD